MGIETALGVLLAIVVIFVVAYAAHYVVTKFFPAELQMPILALVGVILLIAIIWSFVYAPPITLPRR